MQMCPSLTNVLPISHCTAVNYEGGFEVCCASFDGAKNGG